jgi:P4 family phage/plasmid primase-like protien
MKKLQKLAGRTAGIGLDLRRTNNKNNIMKEAKEHFFDKLFLEKLDNNPYLLCFTNGIIDFEKKEFRMTKPDDYVSLCTNIEYIKMDEENVKHMSIKKEITEFMEQLFPDPLLNKYMWQHMAASLKGTNENQVFNIYTGTGRNGKSKLVDLISMALGDYKATVPITLVTSRRTTIGGASPEIAQLKGIRYACMQEPSENMSINEGVMKELTGGDPLSGRALYCDTITFNPQFTLVVCTNHLFDIKSTDDGTWRRIRVCDFESKFLDKPYENEKDFPKKKYPYQFKCVKDIDSRFESWAPYFISMLVKVAFETNGVVEDCPQVLAASQKYKMQQDYFAQFFEERIVPVEGGTIKRKDLQNEFIEWYTELYGGKVPKGKDLYDFMESKLGKCERGRFKDHKLIHSFEQDLDVVPNNI